MTESATTIDRTSGAAWAVKHFADFWADPLAGSADSRLAPDIVGRWPDGKVLVGLEAYNRRLLGLGALIPDIRLEVLEHAVNGDLAFIRWVGRGTGANGRFELHGVDRLRVEDGLIQENIVHFDTAAFEELVGTPLAAVV